MTIPHTHILRSLFIACVLSLFCVSCGGGECATNLDCKEKGRNYTCNTKTKRCVRAATPPKTCSPECRSDEECIDGTCEKKQTGNDCNPACGADQQCINGKCEKKQTGNNCSPGCNTSEICKDGKCVKNTPGPCTPACASDEVCNNGKCEKKQTGGCTPACGADEECKNGKCEKKQTGKTCNPACASDEICKDGKCEKKQTGGCPANCTNDSDCPASECGQRIQCRGGVCAEKQQTGTDPKPATKCDPHQSNPCPQGFKCLQTSQTTAYCFQECTQNANICSNNTDGRTNCRVVTESGTKICLKDQVKGGSCGWQKQIICKAGQKPRLYCSNNGTCKEVQVQGNAGDPCNKQGDSSEPIKECDDSKQLFCNSSGKCAKRNTASTNGACGGNTGTSCSSSDVCVNLSSNDPNGYCLRKCTPGSSSCPGGGRCAALQSGGGVCLLVGTAGEDEVCGNEAGAPMLKTSESCRKGLTCITLSGSRGVCYKTVSNCSSGACASGRKCLSASGGGGICAKDCSSGGTCTKSGTECVELQGGDKICGPSALVGPNDFAAVCSAPRSTKGCKSGFFCLRLTEKSKQGYCSRNCTTDKKCPRGTCVAAGQNSSFCLFKCTSNSSCPSGLTCQSLQSGDKYCFAP